MVVSDPELKLMDIFGSMEKKGGVARKLKEAGMKKLLMGVHMPGGSVQLTKKSMAADAGMASQQIQRLTGFKVGTVTFTSEVKGGTGPSAAPEVSYPRQCPGPSPDMWQDTPPSPGKRRRMPTPEPSAQKPAAPQPTAAPEPFPGQLKIGAEDMRMDADD